MLSQDVIKIPTSLVKLKWRSARKACDFIVYSKSLRAGKIITVLQDWWTETQRKEVRPCVREEEENCCNTPAFFPNHVQMPLRDLWGLSVFNELSTKASTNFALLFCSEPQVFPILSSCTNHSISSARRGRQNYKPYQKFQILHLAFRMSADYISRDARLCEPDVLSPKSKNLLNATWQHAWRSPSRDTVRLMWYEISSLRISTHICPRNPVYLAPIMWQSKYISMTIPFLKLFEAWRSDLNLNPKWF